MPFSPKSSKKYDPSVVVMRGVHKDTKEVRDFSAAELEILRRDSDSSFDRKAWDFSCPCCADNARASHVKTSQEEHPKITHWRLEKGDWHNDENCVLFSPLEAYMRQSGIPVQRRARDNLLELRLKAPKLKVDIDGEFSNATDDIIGGRKNRNSRRSKYATVSQIEALYRCLSTEQRQEVVIREGKIKRSLSEIRIDDAEALLGLSESIGGLHFIVPIEIDWSDYTPSLKHAGYWDIKGVFDGVPVTLNVADEIINLHEGGQISAYQGIIARVRGDYIDGAVSLTGVVTSLQDFERWTFIPSAPGVGGDQYCMRL